DGSAPAIIAACCARAASGHATATPPSSVINARRFTAGPSHASDSEHNTALLHCGILISAMSAWGQQRPRRSKPCDRARPLCPRKQTINGLCRYVHFVPKAEQVALLLDHFVASRKIAASSALLMHRMHRQ